MDTTPVTGIRLAVSIDAHARGDFRIRLNDDTADGPQAGLRYVDARDLDAATEAFDDLFGDDGLDLAATLAYSRMVQRGLGMSQGGPSIRLLRSALDGSGTARAYMASITALRAVLVEARETEAPDDLGDGTQAWVDAFRQTRETAQRNADIDAADEDD